MTSGDPAWAQGTLLCPAVFRKPATRAQRTHLSGPWRAGKASAIRLGWRQLPPKQSCGSPIPCWRETQWRGLIPLSYCSQMIVTTAEASAASTQVVTVPLPQIISDGALGTAPARAPHAPLCTLLLPSHQAGLTPPPAKHTGKRLTQLISAASGSTPPRAAHTSPQRHAFLWGTPTSGSQSRL